MEPTKLFDVSGKTALITGGSRGIGFMIADGLRRAGMNLIIAARKEQEIAAAVEKLGDCVAVQGDVGTADGVAAIVEAATRAGKGLHVLVNNAGMTWGAPIDSFPRDAFDRVMSVNVTGTFDLTRALLPLLRESATPGDPARVINLGSSAGLSPPRTESYPYSASKAAVAMLTRHLARRLAPEHITVNAIAPGVFPSRMTAPFLKDGAPGNQWSIPLGRLGEAEDVVGAILYLASRAGAYVTGAVLPVTGGLTTAD